MQTDRQTDSAIDRHASSSIGRNCYANICCPAKTGKSSSIGFRPDFIKRCIQNKQTQCLNQIIGMFESPKYDVNSQPNTWGIGPLTGRTSRYRCSYMHVLAVILSLTCNFFFICQYVVECYFIILSIFTIFQ